MHFKKKVLKFILTHTFLVLVTVALRHGVCRKMYTLIGGQHAETFENHCIKQNSCKIVKHRVHAKHLNRFGQLVITKVYFLIRFRQI